MHRYYLLAATLLLATSTFAQQLREDYIDWNSANDENFFISRVKPKVVFRDTRTQVHPELTEDIDKRLCMWMPIGTKPFNALPDGAFDRDAFSMWHYVTHLGNWTAPLTKVPGALTDVAHRNGVGVSVTASTPYGALSREWTNRLEDMSGAGERTEEKAKEMASTLEYYGIDGIGYNSEFFTTPVTVRHLADWHEALLRTIREKNPLAEIIWYDGTNDDGNITFDNGLYWHNDYVFGEKDHERSNLFLNYNWNNPFLLERSEDYARQIGRNPLDLYCGFNLQGREPHDEPRWTLLRDYPLSIGLWGAHNENMFFETRTEKGFSSLQKQDTYLKRQEMWFTGGKRSVIGNHEITNSLRYDTDNTEFFGMSAMMSARSALSWSLDDEPFVTCFNIGNGTFFNWMGERQNSNEWYNIGIQDHLPTWRWWIAPSLLCRDAVPTDNITAELSWDDAWMGGSLLRVSGISAEDGYIHLFKTRFELKAGDRISITYKLAAGETQLALVLADNEINATELPLTVNAGKGWQTQTFTVGEGTLKSMADNTLSVIALRCADAKDMDLRIGRLALEREAAVVPPSPVVERASLLARHSHGIDGKVIFSTQGRYNLDSKTSMFRIYSQTEDGTVTCLGATSSWAAIAFSMPYTENANIRIGVSAVGLDMQSESSITWGEWMSTEGVPEVTDETGSMPVEPDIYPETAGHKPSINTIEVGDDQVIANTQFSLVATADKGEGATSQALALTGNAFGFKASDIRDTDRDFFTKPFSVSMWVKADTLYDQTQLFSIHDKTDYWPYTDWGWFWHVVNKDGTTNALTWRCAPALNSNLSYTTPDFTLTPGRWHHLVYVFDQTNSTDIQFQLYLDGKQMIAYNTYAPKRSSYDLYDFRSKNVVAVGGRIHKTDGINGAIDQMEVWGSALTDEEVQTLCRGEELGQEPYCRWDFETSANDEDFFASNGTNTAVNAFMHTYIPGEREGEGYLSPLAPSTMTMGAPLADGMSWKVMTTSEWTVDKGQVVHVADDGLSATTSVPSAGKYSATLVLRNVWGTDSLTITDIEASESTGISTLLHSNGSDYDIYDLHGNRIHSSRIPRGTTVIVRSRRNDANVFKGVVR